jgi:hypothetical protein
MTKYSINDQLTLDDGRQMTITGLQYDTGGNVSKVKTSYPNDNGMMQTNWHKSDSLRERIVEHTPAPTGPTIYVDELRDYGKIGEWCHMWTPDGTDEELTAFAESIGLKPGWSHESDGISGRFFHFDLRPNKRKLAIENGAVEKPLREWVKEQTPTDPAPTPSPDTDADNPQPDLFSAPKQDGNLSEVITPKPAPPPRRAMTPDEQRNTIYYLTACTSMNHNHARSLVEYFGHNVGDALTAGEGLDAAPGIGHVTGPTAASAWNRAPSWVRECLPLGIEGYPPSYVQYAMVYDFASDPDDFRNKFPLPDDEQPFAHLAALHGVSVQQLAVNIYDVAAFIEKHGNRGYSVAEIDGLRDEQEEVLPLHILHRAYKNAHDGILFHANGTGRNDYSGWGVRKKPHWLGMWMDRFKHHAPTLYQDELDTLHDQALKENATPPRPHGRDLIGYSTRKLAYHAACASILIDRYTRCTMFRQQADDRMKIAVYRDRLHLTRRELAFRARYIPTAGDDHYDPRLSLADAIQDYEDANRYIARGHSLEDDRYIGRDQFFTDEYVEQVLCSAAEPDLHIDLDDPSTYPRGTLEQTPAQQLTPKDILVTITRLLLTKTEDEFAEEDKQNFLSLAANLLPDAGAYTDGDAWQRLRARLDKLNLNRS